MPEELWTEVCNIVQEGANKTIPKKTKMKKAKWSSAEAYKQWKKDEKWTAREGRKGTSD